MIPVWLLTKLPFLARVLPFLKGLNWIRIGLVSAIAVMLFVGGCMYSDRQHAEHAADIERQKNELIAERIAEINAEWRAKLLAEENARIALEFDLSIIRDRERDLLAQIGDLQLTKPPTDDNIEACLETEDENVKLVVANPFSLDFVRLYNDAGRAVRTGDSANP